MIRERITNFKTDSKIFDKDLKRYIYVKGGIIK